MAATPHSTASIAATARRRIAPRIADLRHSGTLKPGDEVIHTHAADQLPKEFTVEVVYSKDGGRTQTSGFVELKGEGATPTKRVEIHYLHAPGKPANYPSASITNADGFGRFEVRDEWNLVNGTTEDANVDVNVIARDVTTGRLAVTSLKASRWVSF